MKGILKIQVIPQKIQMGEEDKLETVEKVEKCKPVKKCKKSKCEKKEIKCDKKKCKSKDKKKCKKINEDCQVENECFEVIKESDDEEVEQCVRAKKKNSECGLPPRKAIKKLIQQEVDAISGELFGSLMKNKELMGEGSCDGVVTHVGVQCDGCGICPIMGVRYKCSVEKDFDFCEICEERREHKYPFIKICKPEQAPKSIFCCVNEEEDQKEEQKEEDQKEEDQKEEDPLEELQKMIFECMSGGKFDQKKDVKKMFKNVIHQFFPKEKGHMKFDQRCRDFCRQRMDFKAKRAVVLKKQEDLIEGDLGQIVFAEVTIQNQTKWPWHRGHYIGLSGDAYDFFEGGKRAEFPLIVKDFPID